MSYSNYVKAYEATMFRESRPNYEKSFRGWQKEAALARKTISLVAKMYENQRKKILEDYSTSKASEMLAEEQDRFMEFKQSAEADLRNKLDSVIKSKRDAISKASGAPSAEDIRLLTALSMRTKITESDLQYAAEQLGNSLVSLGTLADIANSHGINFPAPSTEKINESLNTAIDYCNGMIKDLFNSDNNLSYNATEFFLYPDLEDSKANNIFSKVDNSIFSTEQAKKTVSISDSFDQKTVIDNYGAAKVKVSGINPNAVEIKLTGNENVSNLLYQFGVKMDDVMKFNPDIDISTLGEGDKLIIPSGKMKIIKQPGFADVDQCTPIEVQM